LSPETGEGNIPKPIRAATFRFSRQARDKINKSNEGIVVYYPTNHQEAISEKVSANLRML
jgi:hypothetical protein